MHLYEKRKKALIIDSLMVGIVGAFVTFWIPEEIMITNKFIMVIIDMLYLVKDMVFRNASIGMKAFNICIVSQLDNRKPKIWQLLLRNIFFILFWPIEYYFVFVKEKDGLGDRIAKTKLISVDKN